MHSVRACLANVDDCSDSIAPSKLELIGQRATIEDWRLGVDVFVQAEIVFATNAFTDVGRIFAVVHRDKG